MKRVHNTVVTLGLFAIASVANAQSVARYVGADGNWFNPRNWSTGRAPGPTTDVLIAGRSRVVIAPGSKVAIRDLTLDGNAVLETLAGTQFTSRNELVLGNAELIHRATLAGSLDLPGTMLMASSSGGVWLNPTPKTKRIIVLQSSLTIGLGGTEASSAAGYGRGHYATLTGMDVALGGRLSVQTYYGFLPAPGQTFQIVTAHRRALGQFRGLPEGALAARFGDVGLFITYEGGDGNDVVLEARRMPSIP